MGFKLTKLFPENAILPLKLDVKDELCVFDYHLESSQEFQIGNIWKWKMNEEKT